MKPFLKYFILAIAPLYIAGTDAFAATTQATVLRSDSSQLERSEAQRRKKSVADPHYALSLDITEPTEFSGDVSLIFDYRPQSGPQPSEPLTVDFSDGTIQHLAINSRSHPVDYNGSFLSIPSSSLKPGKNVLEIGFRQKYSQDGEGLYRFVDSTDQRVYLYTDFEPYAANRLFPHFDQPDLKAQFTLQVLAPKEWQVISTMRESGRTAEGDDQLWSFPKTPVMSSYVFSMHAGPFAQWQDADFRYPLRLFSRQSLAQHVHAETWFTYTRNGFDFFEPWFDFDYPFLKYDQVIVPDFNSGAMENIAAVTFSERFLSRGEYTRSERQSLAGVIFHEMAHMWFGDITTMAWWDGLWLNESFASLMANLALVNEVEFRDAWHSFFLGYKQWAYGTDELVTTHPIQVPVPDTDTAITIFDGITYGKGSSVLKQLSFYVGEENFQSGVRAYIDANAYANTELIDFTSELAKAADQPLEAWATTWLDRAGFNTIAPELQCQDGNIESLTLRQTATSEYPTLRTHAVELGLFEVKNGRLQLANALPIRIEGALTTVDAVKGQPCPALVYPNFNDWGYLKVSLDDSSLTTLSAHINDLEEALQRSMLWQDLWSMVEGGQLSLYRFLDIAYANLDGESEELVLTGVLRSVNSSLSYLELLGNQQAARNKYGKQFETLIWRQITSTSGDVQRLWFDAFVATASSSSALEELAGLLTGAAAPAQLELNQDLRWNIVVRLNRYAHTRGTQLLAAERLRDSSEEGKRRALQAEVIGASVEGKESWLNTALARGDEYRLMRSRTIMGALYPSNQRHLMTTQAQQILDRLPQIESEQDSLFFRHISRNLIPRLCTEANITALSKAIDSRQSYEPALDKALLVARQLDQRCLAVGANLAL
jgi:aminopeptidase N